MTRGVRGNSQGQSVPEFFGSLEYKTLLLGDTTKAFLARDWSMLAPGQITDEDGDHPFGKVPSDVAIDFRVFFTRISDQDKTALRKEADDRSDHRRLASTPNPEQPAQHVVP
jgi:hypothetical protein